jgi:dTDP-4-amino-4,6-dideoxygalactose transaminase
LRNAAHQPIPFLDLKAQFASIREEILAAVETVFASQQFVLGPQVAALEQELAAYCGSRHAIGVASGTDALVLALRAAGVAPGDEVIVPAMTFIATASAVAILGARPVVADIRPDTFNIDAKKIEAAITARTKAIVPVHLYGQPAEMDVILEIGSRRGIPVIEDNAQAIGATYKGRKTGTMGDFGCLSFYPTKNLGGAGDGGMVLTNSDEFAQRVRVLRDHGQTKKYVSAEPGWNSRLDELQAAVLRVKLGHLDRWNAARRAHAAQYNELLAKISGVTVPVVAPGCGHVYHLYTIRAPRRDHVQQFLTERGIASAVYYPVPLHLQPAFASLGYRAGDCPEAERAAGEILSLPMFPELTAAQVSRVGDAVAEALRG